MGAIAVATEERPTTVVVGNGAFRTARWERRNLLALG